MQPAEGLGLSQVSDARQLADRRITDPPTPGGRYTTDVLSKVLSPTSVSRSGEWVVVTTWRVDSATRRSIRSIRTRIRDGCRPVSISSKKNRLRPESDSNAAAMARKRSVPSEALKAEMRPPSASRRNRMMRPVASLSNSKSVISSGVSSRSRR